MTTDVSSPRLLTFMRGNSQQREAHYMADEAIGKLEFTSPIDIEGFW